MVSNTGLKPEVFNMRGTFVYDGITAVGMVIVVFLIIYWSVMYGTDMVVNILRSDISTIQGTLASAISFSCRPYEYSITTEAETSAPGSVSLKETTIQIIPPEKKYRDWTSVERGGFFQYRGADPAELIRCEGVSVQANDASYSKGKASFTVEKKSSSVGVKVK